MSKLIKNVKTIRAEDIARGSNIIHPVDAHVGQRIKERRVQMGMTQGQLGQSIGLTFQQIQKYERGANRVSASKMWQLARVFNITPQYFFDDMSPEVLSIFPAYEGYHTEVGLGDDEVTIHRRQTMELMKKFSSIHDQKMRKQIINLIEGIGQIQT